MKLVLDIAWTHVSARLRQTLVGMLGVAMGGRLFDHDGGLDGRLAKRLHPPARR